MEIKLIKSSHAIGESNYHLVLTPAYRRDVFFDKLIRELTLGYILTKLKQLKVDFLAYNFGPDHMHLFVCNVRFVSEIELVRQIKGYSSYMMRKGHKNLFINKLWGKKFWSGGHFYRSVGAVNKETVTNYVEQSQEKHWKVTKEQRELIAY
jgi:REP element-mobilizing transposase RayT